LVEEQDGKPTTQKRQEPKTKTKVEETQIPFVNEGLVTKTKGTHKTILADLKEMTKGKPPTTQEVLSYLKHRETHPRQAEKDKLVPTTTRTLLGNILGALEKAELYGLTEMKTTLKEEATMKLALKTTTQKANAHEPKIYSAKKEEILASLDRLFLQTEQRMYLLLWWLTASRPSSIDQMDFHNVQFRKEGRMMIKFVKGKTVAVSGPYTVHTAVTEELKTWVEKKQREQPKKQESWWKKDTRTEVLVMLKKENVKIEMRSLRRGALQAMSNSGVPDSTLLEFSRHRDLQMLYRYLNWGMENEMNAVAGMAAGQHLLK
jgi:hypothetical protein